MVGHRRRAVIAAAVAAAGYCLGPGGATAARAAEPTTRELMEQIKALQDKVQQLESTQDRRQQQIQSSKDADATVAQVIADAERRSQLLEAGGNFTAGYSKGKFLIQDDKGDFVFHPNIQFMPRFAANYKEGGNGTPDNSESGFEIRRLKVGFDGNVYGPDLTYFFLWATDRN